MLPPTANSWISRVEAERTYADLYHRLTKVEKVLAHNGVEIHSGSRLQSYRRRLEDLQRPDLAATLPPEELSSLNSVLLEADQLARSVLTLTSEPETDGWSLVVKRALKGPASATPGTRPSPARDAQFEILVASLAKRGGLSVRLLEPDLQVALPAFEPVGKAAKRVKSAAQLHGRVSDASKQIKKSHLPGVVAVDLAFFSNRILRAPDMASAMEQLLADNRRFTRSRLESLHHRVSAQHPLGIITFVSKMVQLGKDPQLATIISAYATNLLGLQDERLKLFDGVVAGLDEGSRRWLS